MTIGSASSSSTYHASDGAAYERFLGRWSRLLAGPFAEFARPADHGSVLDVGCGTGDLALAALRHGARSVSGFDLGAGAISNARGLAQERGLSERATFEVGDGSQAALPKCLTCLEQPPES